MFTSCTRSWLNLLSMSVRLVIVPRVPETVIWEGYKEAGPVGGMVIGEEFTKRLELAGGGLTVSKKLVLAVSVPSLTVTVMVALPLLSPNFGVTVMYQCPPAVPKKMFPGGTTFESDVVPLSCRFNSGVSASPNVS